MHTLDQLERGELAGITRLDLAADLRALPPAIFDLADSLEVLNLSGNRLTQLPDDLPRLHKLRILFCSQNPFRVMPEVLGACPSLEMIGFRSCALEQVPETALPKALRWLILTDNRLDALPASLGDCTRLQKLMLAGNRLAALPEQLAQCQRLELLRIAANRLESLPDWLFELPRLAWLAFAGNPFSDASEARILAEHPLPPVPWTELELGGVLGEGASGIIRQARWHERPMALKTFKGAVTSDGLAHSEMAACVAAGRHRNLIGVAGPLAQEPQRPPALLMELIDPRFQPLAGPPSLASCTRDCYDVGRRFTPHEALAIARGAVSAAAHLHALGILHGDLYAHNLLAEPGGQCLLGDFGAASFFDCASAWAPKLVRLESRALGCLFEELIEHCAAPADARIVRLGELAGRCLSPRLDERPSAAELDALLAGL